MDTNGVFDRAWTGTELRLEAVTGTPTAGNTVHDANWVWSAVFNQATNSIRVIRVG